MLKRKEAEKNPQLKLGIKHSPLNFLAKYKLRFEISRARWDVKRYTKSSWVLFTIVISISLLITQIFTIQENIEKLPDKIPLFQIYVNTKDTLATRDYIYLIPLISIFILISGIILSNKYYNKERTLANTLLWSMFLAIFITTVSLIRLVNLY